MVFKCLLGKTLKLTIGKFPVIFSIHYEFQIYYNIFIKYYLSIATS